MTTNHQPATPLPFKDGPLFGHDPNRALFWTDTSKPGKWQRRVDADYKGAFNEQDAAYIAHAANAYPKLIAALRVLSERVESGMLINHPQSCAERREENAQACDRASSLLRELGEE